MIHIISFWIFLLLIVGIILYRKLIAKTAKTVIKEADKAANLIKDENIEDNK